MTALDVNSDDPENEEAWEEQALWNVAACAKAAHYDAPSRDGTGAAAGPIGGAGLLAVQGSADAGRLKPTLFLEDDDDDSPESRGRLHSSADARGQDGGKVVTFASESPEPFFRHVHGDESEGRGLHCVGFLRRAPGNRMAPFGHDVFDSIERASAAAVDRGADPHLDIYFTPFKLRERKIWDANKGKNVVRVQSNTIEAGCIFLDLDCGKDKNGKDKDYPSQEAAITAVAAFCEAIKLRRPTLLSSGYGVQCFHTFGHPLPREDWLRVATKFHRLREVYGLKADTSRTLDTASVMRVPGTCNRKKPADPRPVRVLAWGKHTPAAEMEAIIDRELAARSVGVAAGPSSRKASAGAGVPGGVTSAGVLSPFDFSGLEAACDVTVKLPPPAETSENVVIVRAMLAKLDPDCDRDMWRRLVWAVLATRWSCAQELVRAWSVMAKQEQNRGQHGLDELIDGFNPARGITLGTLVYFAREAGYTGPVPVEGSACQSGAGLPAEAGLPDRRQCLGGDRQRRRRGDWSPFRRDVPRQAAVRGGGRHLP